MEPSFKKLRTLTLKDQFVQEIENMIISGRFPIGSKLPTERELSEKMGVSRAVVNSGLSEMENKGFLEIRPRSGTYVADYKRTGTLEVLASIMRYDGHSFRNDMGDSLLQFRLAIEESAASLAAEHRTAEQLDALRSLTDEMSDSISPESMADLSFYFHHLICIASDNPIYPIAFHSFKTILCSVVTHMYRCEDRSELIAMHRAVIEALGDGDAAGSAAAIRALLVSEVGQSRKLEN